MERRVLGYKFVLLFGLLLFIVSPAYANDCVLTAELVNQDPYPALPGDYFEVLFQLNGIDNNCQDGVSVDLELEYPFSFDVSESDIRVLESSAYVDYDYRSFWNNVYEIRVHENALEGEYELEFKYKEGTDSNWDTYYSTKSSVKVDDAMIDFEIHVDNYNIKNRDLVFQIINIGNQDVDALVVEIIPQNNILVRGSNKNIVGDLDSNEYTSASFEAIPSDGEITLILHYTDSINERRTMEEIVHYNSVYFVDSLENIEPDSNYMYVIVFSIFLIIIIIFFKRYNTKKKKTKKFSI